MLMTMLAHLLISFISNNNNDSNTQKMTTMQDNDENVSKMITLHEHTRARERAYRRIYLFNKWVYASNTTLLSTSSWFVASTAKYTINVQM